MRAIVFQKDARRPWLANRSARSLRAAGFEVGDEVDGPCLLLKAGQVLKNPSTFHPPPMVRDGNLVAVGLPETGAWSNLHEACGGDYHCGENLPPPVCEWHSCANSASARLNGGPLAGSPRVVHWPPLDLGLTDDRLSVFEVVTSLQHGGAEKIARDLAQSVPAHGIASRLIVLGKPHRTPLDAPPATLDLSDLPRSKRAACLAALAVAHGVDVLHLHLIDAAETRELSASGIPVIATVHNTRAGWPSGWQTLAKTDLSLMLACSQAVELELRESLPELPVRTVWNGIAPREFPETPLPPATGGFVIACVANPRPQKRLHLLPAILAATRDELSFRGITKPSIRLVIAGETSANLADAIASRAEVDQEALKHGVSADIRWTEGGESVRQVLAAAHALVSCSAHEGLSLAHLEALSSGRPVVACDTGGTRELAWRNPSVTLLDITADITDFAKALADVLLDPPPSAHRLVWRDFTTDRMADRVARFCRQAASRPPVAPETIWFVTNNLSTGGAQSSLRRLVKEFQNRGRRVRLALLQEYPEHPTAGRLDLLDHGIDVFVPPPSGLIESAESVDLILAEMSGDPPGTLVFWNAITVHKMLLADAMPFTPVHDISPGEMWFTSLERCLDNPPPGLPCRTAADYGRLLAGIVVKYSAEADRAAALGTRVTVIPNGVAVPNNAPRPQRVAGPRVFGTAARISPQKRLDELIAAFRIALPELPGAVLKIAGGVETGAEECAADLRRLAVGLPVEWLGETQDIASFHAACDVFVMISDPAGCPNASLEALAAGLPVIATDVGGASEQVIDGVNGLLVPARDIESFARAMVEISANPASRDSMGIAAREHIIRMFTLERMTSDYLALFSAGSPASAGIVAFQSKTDFFKRAATSGNA
jgi:glycosyltransferase involved in cell wall biosynthesis